MKKALVVIDYQNDFVTGALGTKQAQAVKPAVLAKIEQYRQAGYPVIYTRDTHGPDYLATQEGKNLPVEHCIKGTQGWQIVPDVYVHGSAIVDKPTFGSVELAAMLAQAQYDAVEFVGVCTGICVISNALLLKAHDLDVKVIVDAACCACVTPESHANALAAMQLCQVQVING